jgi:hypothetical protein
MGAEQSTAAPAADGEVVQPPSAAVEEPAVDLDALADMEASAVVKILTEATGKKPPGPRPVVEHCCKRIRVLCRAIEQCEICDQAGAGAAVLQAMSAFPSDREVQLQSLAAIVNLCSGEASGHRQNAVDAGALQEIVNAMRVLLHDPEVQEMGCIALQNCCYGEDERAVARRQTSAQVGAIEAVLQSMKTHSVISQAQEVGIATLKLIVHKAPDVRQKAISGAWSLRFPRAATAVCMPSASAQLPK